VITLKRALIAGMFSSVSDAELVTEMLDAADFKENNDYLNNDISQIENDNHPLLR
jgi:hypothetical protein